MASPSLRKCPCLPIATFDCGDADLNEWFRKDIVASTQALLTQTCALIDPEDPLALVSACNDAVSLRDLEGNFDVPEGKRLKSWPAVKIARLGVSLAWQGSDLGTHVINLLKRLFITDNRTGCRIMTVDAYNLPRVIKFYTKNNFLFLVDRDQGDPTRTMWFDLAKVTETEIKTSLDS